MDVIRPAGLFEKRCIVREYLGLYNNIITIGTYSWHGDTARANPRITENHIIKALKYCIEVHPALSTIVRYVDTEKFSLVRVPKVDIAQHLQIPHDVLVDAEGAASSGVLKVALERLHNEPLCEADDCPQWRVLVARTTGGGFHLAFACSHSLMDGKSGYAFHATFLDALREVDCMEEFDDVDPILPTTKSWNPLPPIEKAGNLTVSWAYLLGPLAKEYFPKTLTRWLGLEEQVLENLWFGATKKPTLPEGGDILPTGVCVVSVPEEVMEVILVRARAHDAKLTGLLTFLVARTLARALTKRGQEFTSFAADIPLDLRTALGKGYGKIANYASCTADTISVPRTRVEEQDLSDNEWSKAASTTKILAAASRTLADQPVGLLRYLTNFREYSLKNARALASSSFEMSNLGLFDGTGNGNNSDGQWKVDQMLFSQAANAGGPPLNFNVSSAKGGDLTITATWWREVLGVRDEDRFVKEVCEGVVDDLKFMGSW